MRELLFHPAATAETAESAAFYNSQQMHLGKRFLCAVEEAATRVKVDPLLYPVIEPDVRRCLLKTFPFCILFRVKKKRVVVVAVMHLRRKPDYWKERLTTSGVKITK